MEYDVSYNDKIRSPNLGERLLRLKAGTFVTVHTPPWRVAAFFLQPDCRLEPNSMISKPRVLIWVKALAACFLALLWSPLPPGVSVAFSQGAPPPSGFDGEIIDYASKSFNDGRQTFRFDTFGSEDFWGGMLRLHLALAGTANGGIAEGVSPRMALSVGLKVDVEALPASVVQALSSGMVASRRSCRYSRSPPIKRRGGSHRVLRRRLGQSPRGKNQFNRYSVRSMSLDRG